MYIFNFSYIQDIYQRSLGKGGKKGALHPLASVTRAYLFYKQSHYQHTRLSLDFPALIFFLFALSHFAPLLLA